MRVQTEEWRRFIPGVRMYKGKLTYFYNGEILYDADNDKYLIYNLKERLKWEVIMILPGVEVIPDLAFSGCKNVETVIMSDNVRRIERAAFCDCWRLEFVGLSKNIEYIGEGAFQHCNFTSIFIPPSCREIGTWAFLGCKKLIILSVPRHTYLGDWVIASTALIKSSHFEIYENGVYDHVLDDEVNEWIKSINETQDFALHRECASMEPSQDNIYELIQQQGLPSIRVKNEIGVTPLEYLRENPYIDNQIDQHKLIKRLVLDLMGEIIA